MANLKNKSKNRKMSVLYIKKVGRIDSQSLPYWIFLSETYILPIFTITLGCFIVNVFFCFKQSSLTAKFRKKEKQGLVQLTSESEILV